MPILLHPSGSVKPESSILCTVSAYFFPRFSTTLVIREELSREERSSAASLDSPFRVFMTLFFVSESAAR